MHQTSSADPARGAVTRGRRARHRVVATLSAALLTAGLALLPVGSAQAVDQPWMNTSLSPDRRADLLADAMTLD